MFENVRVALNGLRSNKLRSALTMLGITIGVAAVIVLVSVGQAIDGFIRGEFEGIGTNLVYVLGQVDNFERPKPMTYADVEAISDPYRVPEAMLVMPQLDLRTQQVIAEGQEDRIHTVGTGPQYPELFARGVVAGRFFDEDEANSSARVAVITKKVVDSLFAGEYPLGKTIRIGGVRFTVIGLMEEQGSDFGPPGTDLDDLIYIPITTAQTRLSGQRVISGDRPITNVVVAARDSSDVDLLAQQIRQTLREERGIAFRDEDNFQVVTQGDLLNSFTSVTALLTVFLGFIAGISLLVGGIGIMNIMLVTVTERTREIGLRKAVGAQKVDIMLQFLVESIVLALLGGGIGVLLAGMATFGAAAALGTLDVAMQPSSVMLATMISTVIGVFFGIYPANRAASLNPIDALRYE
ncbi:MAG: ABC transporter permease [Anaerolineae bacterium]|jgi:putative ABC transport system permease protein|nr:ABC transporter permease [Anaerolineae bacterium]